MRKLDVSGVKESAVQRRPFLYSDVDFARSAVSSIADDRMFDESKMNAKLVSATGVRLRVNQSKVMEAPADPVEGNGFAGSNSIHFHPDPVHRIAADGSLDFAAFGFHATVDKSLITLVHAPGFELGRQLAMRDVVLGNQDDAGSHLVQTMDNSRPQLPTHGRKAVAQVVKQSIDKRAGFCSRANVHRHSGRLIDNSQVFVLIQDSEGKIFGNSVDNLMLCTDADLVARLDFFAGL